MLDFLVNVLCVIWLVGTVVAFCYGAHVGSLNSPRGRSSPFFTGLMHGITLAFFWPVILLGLGVFLPAYAKRITSKKDDPPKDGPRSN